ncbi:MAG: hypothetical protein CMP23_14110 [Rickettsiales bacterium]|nr:hypothetical protein [Rickettsiales bacterium]
MLILTLCGVSLLPAAWTAALHCDEFVVIEHVSDFYRGHFRGAGRPGLLWMALTPLIALEDPVWIPLAARLSASLASALTLVACFWFCERAARYSVAAPEQAAAEATSPPSGWPWYGLSAVLLLATSMSWQSHSFEVRTDTYVIPLSLLAMGLLWRAELPWKRAVLVGLLVAATGLISQKSLYNAVALGAGWLLFSMVLLYKGGLSLKRHLMGAAIAVFTALSAVAAWYLLMALLQEDTGFVGSQLGAAVRTAFKESTPFANKLRALKMAIGYGPVLWAAGGLGTLVALWKFGSRPLWLASLVMTTGMLGTIFFHRGFFLYYIASFDPYVALLAGAAVGSACCWLERRFSRWLAVALLVLLVAGQAQLSWAPYKNLLASNMQPQLSVMRSAVEVFPEPVPYWDAIGMVPGYEETTFFGTALARKWFRQGSGRNGFIERARKRKPHFFIRNYMTRRRYLHTGERKWLWKHYLPYRPNLYLHGGRMQVDGEVAEQEVELLVSGSYTVWFMGEWAGKAWLNGEPIEHGQIVPISEGRHRLRAHSKGEPGQLWLMLGEDREPLIERSDQHIDYSMFTLLARQRYQQYDDKKNERSDLRTPDHDPTIGRVNEKKRHRRHQRWQRKVDRSDGSPR